ncbi:hypothetical protein PSP6_440130 [Paraburkholderia tropica]|nr:hypothetical protein PSP6_440130 [Paraburkholderia tropica]
MNKSRRLAMTFRSAIYSKNANAASEFFIDAFLSMN